MSQAHPPLTGGEVGGKPPERPPDGGGPRFLPYVSYPKVTVN